MSASSVFGKRSGDPMRCRKGDFVYLSDGYTIARFQANAVPAAWQAIRRPRRNDKLPESWRKMQLRPADADWRDTLVDPTRVPPLLEFGRPTAASQYEGPLRVVRFEHDGQPVAFLANCRNRDGEEDWKAVPLGSLVSP